MMDFNEFTDYVMSNIKNYLPQEYSSADIRMDQVDKTNERYNGLTLRLENSVASPVLNMDKFYEQYQEVESLDNVLANMSTILQTEIPPVIDMDKLKDYEQARDILFVRLSSAVGNESILKTSPHQMVADLVMTYHLHIPGGEEGFMSARITNEMLKEYGITQEQLHQDALANTGRIFEPKTMSFMEIMTGVPEENPNMMIVTNTSGMLGAGALFCEDMLDKVADQMQGDYFVLPSSIHELIIVPDNGDFARPDLEKMVHEANEAVVDVPDRLSDSVYHYDHKDRVFERADAFEQRSQEKESEKGSLLNKLNDKKEQIERNPPSIGKNKQRQAGIAI